MTSKALKPSDSLAYLKRYNTKAKKHFGQNFIIDNNIVEKIARVGDAHQNVVLEIGPGLGALTHFLLRDAKQVIAVEIDKDCVDILQERFEQHPNLILIEHDFLKLDPKELDGYPITHLIANLPYYITTPILFHVIENYPRIHHFSIMVQKEVADRFRAHPKTKAYGALSIILQSQFEIHSEMQVPPSVFYPKPKVSSSVVNFKRKENSALDERFFKLVKLGFAQRRKTLVNNLKHIPHMPDILRALGHDVAIRSEALDPTQWLQLFDKLKNDSAVPLESLLK
jgi:16S rRNA (adenine1518-N6/adenine1519-N6)-dimethyltransferase